MSSECQKTGLRLKQIEEELDSISNWKLTHEEEIESAKSSSARQFENVMNKVEDIDYTLEQTQRVS